MKPNFNVDVVSLDLLSEIPGAWTAEDYGALLDDMNFGDRSALKPKDAIEMCRMMLQDQEPAEAATALLKHKLGDELSSGQIQNIAVEMQNEKLWEEYADNTLHRRLYDVGSLLHASIPAAFPKPDAMTLVLNLRADNEPAKEYLAQDSGAAFWARVLASGQGEHSVMHRLYEEKILASQFSQADTIVWKYDCRPEEGNEGKAQATLIGSSLWLSPMAEIESYTTHAYPDEEEAAEDTH